MNNYHTEHLNTPCVATNQAGTVVWRWDGGAFGETAPNQDPDGDGNLTTVNLRYPGQYFDSETGLHYNWNRYYDPKIGRYITSDPIGLNGGMNTYTYVNNNPLRWTDPLGLVVQICSTIPHTFLCVDGNCSGKYPSGNWWASPGEIRDDSDNKSSASCSNVPNQKSDPNCFEQCVAKRISNRGPSGDLYNYSSANCGQWAEDVILECRTECTK